MACGAVETQAPESVRPQHPFSCAARAIYRGASELASQGQLDSKRARGAIGVWRQCASVVGGDASRGMIAAFSTGVESGFGEGARATDPAAERPDGPLDVFRVLELADETTCCARASMIRGRVALECSDEFARYFLSTEEWEKAVAVHQVLPVLAWASLLEGDDLCQFYEMVGKTMFDVHGGRSDAILVLQWRGRDSRPVRCVASFRADIDPDTDSCVEGLEGRALCVAAIGSDAGRGGTPGGPWVVVELNQWGGVPYAGAAPPGLTPAWGWAGGSVPAFPYRYAHVTKLSGRTVWPWALVRE